jgi:hypothetical protein
MAVLSAGLFVLTLISRERIEVLFGVDRDHGDATREWAITSASLLTTLFLLMSARKEWQRDVLGLESRRQGASSLTIGDQVATRIIDAI